MAENLNCEVSGSKCYDNDPSNCAKYGRMIGKRPKKYVRWRSFKGRKKAENCENVYWGYYDKAYGFSVRCLQENLFFLLEGLA